MTSHLRSISLLLVATGLVWGQSDNNVPPRDPGSNANYQNGSQTEIRKLRIEFLEFRIEIQAAKVSVLERGMEQIQTERLKFSEEERNRPQPFAAIESNIQSQAMTSEQQAEFDAIRGKLAAEQASRVEKERASFQARENELSAGLRLEGQRLDALKAKLNDLTAAR